MKNVQFWQWNTHLLLDVQAWTLGGLLKQGKYLCGPFDLRDSYVHNR